MGGLFCKRPCALQFAERLLGQMIGVHKRPRERGKRFLASLL